MKRIPPPRQLAFESRLERISETVNYFAVPVPAEITDALGTRGPVPVSARVNGSSPFLVSLYPKGGGRHGMRVKASVRQEAKIKEADRVRVEITVLDAQEVDIPPDVARAFRAEGVLESFKALPPGKRRYTIRRINEAAQPQTRAKRIQQAIEEARR